MILLLFIFQLHDYGKIKVSISIITGVDISGLRIRQNIWPWSCSMSEMVRLRFKLDGLIGGFHSGTTPTSLIYGWFTAAYVFGHEPKVFNMHPIDGTFGASIVMR